MAALPNCSYGSDENECHLTHYWRKQGLIEVAQLEQDDRQLLFLRTGLDVGDDGKICLHHQQVYLIKYKLLQKSCADPRKVHKKTVYKALSPIPTHDIQWLNQLEGVIVKPGQKLCVNCMKQLKTEHSELPEGPQAVDDPGCPYISTEAEEETLNVGITGLGVSPLKAAKISQPNKLWYGKRKLRQVDDVVTEGVATVLGVQKELHPQTGKPCPNPTDHDDLKRLVECLKEKVSISSRQKQVQLLTLVPESWTIDKTATEFGVTKYMVRQAKSLKSTKGVMSEPDPKVGKPLSEGVKERVVHFYENDEHSRLLPGAKDYKSVRDSEGRRTHKQKRLLLMNLNELHLSYKEKYPEDIISLSKFCELRPDHCITVGCRGTHSVCVCSIHQNVKLMVDGLPADKSVTYHDLMGELVCSVNSKLCMVHRCPDCPGADGLLTALENICDVNDSEEEVRYKQWQTTDRTTLHSCCKPVNLFLEELVEKTDKLTAHHYIAKSQTKYLTHLKENLKQDEAIIILDFAENYSFIVQDAAQGYHWDNTQATLHPFVVYYRPSSELEHKSLCVLSDCLQHDTITVHTFQNVVVNHLKHIHQEVRKVYYFSDGAASQYKNYKNFCNLVYHKDDFGLLAEWHFFATSHGKNACDGVGGTVKREASKASLQAITSGHILTPRDLYDWGAAHLHNITFFYVTKEEVTAHAEPQNNRFQEAKTVSGTRDFHSFMPTSKRTLHVRRTSSDDTVVDANVLRVAHVPSSATQVQYEIGQYIACTYDGKWWIGLIRDRSNEEDDVQVLFMHPHGPSKSFHWPRREDICWVPIPSIITHISAPTTPNARQYYLNQQAKDILRRI